MKAHCIHLFKSNGLLENPKYRRIGRDTSLASMVSEVVLNLVREGRWLGNGCVGHVDMSSGSNFSAMTTGLWGMVEAAEESRRYDRMVAQSALTLGVALKAPK